MDRLNLYRSLVRPADTRILYYIVDGIGGLPRGLGGKTELEMAATPTFDRLANEGSTGLVTPVAAGVAPALDLRILRFSASIRSKRRSAVACSRP